MIVGIFHQGSGLGNQLHRYVTTRVLALDKGYEWGMIAPSNFKGSTFMSLDMGKQIPETWITVDGGKVISQSDMPLFEEKKVVENGIDVRGYDPEISFVSDNSIIDGEFQDSKYFEHRLSEINEWLTVQPMEIPDDICMIGFRGGEFAGISDLFLTREYWDGAIQKMKELNPNMSFEVHTDDGVLAKKFFPDFNVIQNTEINWRSMRYAKYAIIANSSFYILPRLLNGGITIAPRYWARRNIKVWCLPQNYYRQFTYI